MFHFEKIPFSQRGSLARRPQAFRGRIGRRTTAILAVPLHGQDARGTSSLGGDRAPCQAQWADIFSTGFQFQKTLLDSAAAWPGGPKPSGDGSGDVPRPSWPCPCTGKMPVVRVRGGAIARPARPRGPTSFQLHGWALAPISARDDVKGPSGRVMHELPTGIARQKCFANARDCAINLAPPVSTSSAHRWSRWLQVLFSGVGARLGFFPRILTPSASFDGQVIHWILTTRFLS